MSILDLDLEGSVRFATTSFPISLRRFINAEYLSFVNSGKNDCRNWKTSLADVIKIVVPG